MNDYIRIMRAIRCPECWGAGDRLNREITDRIERRLCEVCGGTGLYSKEDLGYWVGSDPEVIHFEFALYPDGKVRA